MHYLYYVAAADGCGEQAFSDSYAQFQRNVDAYQAAVNEERRPSSDVQEEVIDQ